MASNSGENWAASTIRATKGVNVSGLKTAAVRIYPTQHQIHCTVNGSRKPNNQASTACKCDDTEPQYSNQTMMQFQAGTSPTEPT